MTLKQFSFLFLAVGLVFSACSGDFSSDTDIGSSEISLTSGTQSSNSNENSEVSVAEVTIQSQSRPTSYQPLSFSSYLFYDETQRKLLIDWNFFPSTDYDSSAKTLTLPCEIEFSRTTPEGLNFSESVLLTDLPCENEIVLDLSQASFKAYGLVFDFDGELSVLVDDFNVVITLTGFETTEGEAIALNQGEAGDLTTVLSKL